MSDSNLPHSVGTPRRSYALLLLAAIFAFNGVDRQALGLTLQDIKGAFALTDTQLGLLSGIAFALFYSFMGIPIARWADRGNRIAIIALTTAVWSFAVALCALARTFLQLILIRVCVGVGEAGCIPPAMSLISDWFRREERPRALALYLLGAPLSVVIGYFAAGWLNELYGWRWMFALLGLPGLLLAPLTWFTLRDPRSGARGSSLDETTRPSVRGREGTDTAEPLRSLPQTIGALWRNVTFRHLLISFSVMAFFSNGIGQWLPAFFIRTHGLRTGELGTWFAAIWGIGGAIGTYGGGVLATRYAPNDERLQLAAMAVAYGGCGVVSAGVYLASTAHVAFGCLAVTAVAISAIFGPLFASLQGLVPERTRATAVALIYLFANLIGIGLGPLAAGVLSDALQPRLGPDSLRVALLILCAGYVWAAWHLWHARRTIDQDLAALRKPAPADVPVGLLP